MRETQPFGSLQNHPLVAQARHLAEQAESLQDLYRLEFSMNLSELGITAQPVRPQGTRLPNPIMLLAKSPAATEVKTGLPFAGPAGQILRQAFIEAGEDIELYHQSYATRWRPRKDNTPNATQLAISRPFVEREIELLRPRRIIILGAAASDVLYGSHPPMDDDTEYQTQWRGIPAVIVRNNGYVLRNPHLAKAYAESFARWGYRSEAAKQAT